MNVEEWDVHKPATVLVTSMVRGQHTVQHYKETGKNGSGSLAMKRLICVKHMF